MKRSLRLHPPVASVIDRSNAAELGPRSKLGRTAFEIKAIVTRRWHGASTFYQNAVS